MTDEERQRTMDFILQQQAQFAAGMQSLEEADARASIRLDRLERTLVLMARQFRRERGDLRERTTALTNAQIKSEEKLSHSDERQTQAEENFARSNERLTRVEESFVRSDARLTRLEDLTERNSKAIAALTASDDRNRQDIAALAKVVGDLARRRDGGGDSA
jgi:septation ring formation regulator EzrA